jgi:hypothetical protein
VERFLDLHIGQQNILCNVLSFYNYFNGQSYQCFNRNEAKSQQESIEEGLWNGESSVS